MKDSSERKSNPDLCDAGPVLHQSNYQANWELVIMWVNDKHVDSGYMRSNQLIKFHLNCGWKPLLMLMIFAALLRYLSTREKKGFHLQFKGNFINLIA